MKKRLAVILALAMVFTMLFGFSSLAADTNTITYYDENGNEITINGMYYNSQGCPMYNANCYYLDEDGNPVYVGGCRAYYYDEYGNLVPGNYYYNADGKAVSPPSTYPGGRGCGRYYYNSQGNVVNGTFYYDDFGNPVEAPATTTTPAYRGGGCCGHRR